ncbi:transposase [Candidatus Methylospira mobilis]|uniref:Transposase n=1 Tax=Candidatus Methylospira mobilis TaxID=1808979 RepID=A0A5Q0BMK3_9GAMM|nr:transposase [Candidatus Methylospira mobilis]
MIVNIKALINDASGYEKIRELRWPNGVCCPQCGSADAIKRDRDDKQKERQSYACKACSSRFAYRGPCGQYAENTSAVFRDELNHAPDILQELSFFGRTRRKTCVIRINPIPSSRNRVANLSATRPCARLDCTATTFFHAVCKCAATDAENCPARPATEGHAWRQRPAVPLQPG